MYEHNSKTWSSNTEYGYNVILDKQPSRVTYITSAKQNVICDSFLTVFILLLNFAADYLKLFTD